MAVDTKLITKLREITGAGIGDCKAALEEGDSNIDKAIEILRKKGAVKAAKKAERITKEGVIAIAKDGQKLAVVALACETDFAAINGEFINAADSLAKKLLAAGSDGFKESAEEFIKSELVVKIGENIQLTAAELIDGPVLGSYLHSNKKVASVVVLNSGSETLAADLAMQVAAMAPKYVKPEDILPAEIAKEKEIYREQLKGEGKPEAMWDKIIPGKLNKYYQEFCLIKQPFIKDDKITIEQLIKEQGGNIEVIKFFRFQI
ncbi:MAG: translation elongation factor Ts [Patescibacteria group bacterium]|jgi:elongation factor Ts